MPKESNPKIPTLDLATDIILYRSLRHNLDDGSRRERGTDLFVANDADGTTTFYFRYWTWNSTSPGICQITSREEAARFVRDRFTKPGLFSGWNHREIKGFLPEVYRNERLQATDRNPA
nr:hypothetical protein [uncultured Methanoregula sp.]